MRDDRRDSKRFARLARPLLLLFFLIGTFYVHIAVVYAQPFEFHFNDRYTTPFGPAYADIVTKNENFLACKPPVAQAFSYALCYYSGPAVGTPVPANGSAPINPSLPCKLSSDGKSANCTCYGLSTEQYPPYVPYFIDINAILNLDLYLTTIAACGHDGANCDPREPIRENMPWNKAPACQAANRNMVIPTAQLISVFSPVLSGEYGTGSTSCTAGKYAGCMTAPCYHTGKVDSAGNELVECKCPVYDGPFEIGQANMPCDANKLTPRQADGLRPQPQQYVWSAAHNPKLNPPDPPATGCLPDMAGGKGCPLYSPAASYPVTKGSPLCKKVCESYKKDIRQSSGMSPSTGIQVAYSCDAALCTTLGIGQTTQPRPNPLKKASLLKSACGNLAEQSGLQAILALELIDQCSCCASQICGCDNPGTDINAGTQAEIAKLNARQVQLEITPQCQINGTLCGAQKP
jgi:hypothetical protein